MRDRFEFHPLFEAPELLHSANKSVVFLRHDVDLSLKRALKMAEMEHRNRVCATYMVMISSPLYDVRSPESIDIIAAILSLGHEIGLHIDHLSEYDTLPGDDLLEQTLEQLDSGCAQLEQVAKTKVRSISFHRPHAALLRGPLVVRGKVNSYAAELMNWYLSDSRGRWIEGEPLAQLARPRGPLLQLLTHPIWWDDDHRLPEDRLQDFFNVETHGWHARDAHVFDIALAQVIPGVRRRSLVSMAE